MAARRLKILFLAPGWPPHHPAGSEVMGQTICRYLVQAGHQVTVSTSAKRLSADRDYELDGVRVLGYAGIAQDHDRAKGADLIIGHLADAGRVVAYGNRNRVPSVVISHNYQTLPNATLTVFNSEWLAAEHGRNRPHIIVRPHVAVADYATTPGDRVTLINANPDKGIHTVIAIAEEMPDTEFLVVEGAYGGPVKPENSPNIEWQPMLPPDQMRDRVYARTRILLMPSRYESWGRTAAEAMASGIPVIAHPTPGLRECLGSAGTFADRDDIDAWVKAIKRLQTPRGWGTASKKAKARALELEAQTTSDLADLAEVITDLHWNGGPSREPRPAGFYRRARNVPAAKSVRVRVRS